MLAVDTFDTDTLLGLFSLIAGPLALIAGGLAAWKVQDAARWKSAALAERQEREAIVEGIGIRDARIRSTNEWAKTLEARYNEREALVTALEERVNAQAEHIHRRDDQIAQLLERTPEKLWEAVERHSAAALEQWTHEREWQVNTVERLEGKLDLIVERLETIGRE